jgi:hypothetical protein
MMMQRLALRDRPGGNTTEARMECHRTLTILRTPVFSFQHEYLAPLTMTRS